MRIIINLVKGVVSALLAAYIFIALYTFIPSDMSNFASSFIVIPIFGLLYTFWLVIPVGAVLGLVIPTMVNNRSRQTSVLYGGLLGAGVGAIVCILLSLIGLLPALRNGVWLDFTVLLLAMMLYSAAWTGIYAFFCRSKFA